MLNNTKKILKDIKNIKIQGASNIVFATYNVFESEFKNAKKIDKKYFENLIINFWHSRPTEPALKNFLTNLYLLLDCDKKTILDYIEKSKINQKNAINIIANKFASSIKEKVVVFTHCHSSLVEQAIKKLKDENKLHFVVNTETRPLFQGRITAQRLAEYNIKVFHIVDSAAYAVAKNLKKEYKKIIFITGADVITNNGALINKIGTSQISLAFKTLGIKHFVLSLNSKVDVVDKNWSLNEVELRDPKEVWSINNKNIDIWNYAFDVTPSYFINNIFTETYKGKTSGLVLHCKVSEKFKNAWKYLDQVVL